MNCPASRAACPDWRQRELDFDAPEPDPDPIPVTILPPYKAWIDAWQGPALELRRSKSGRDVLVEIGNHEVWFPAHRVVSV